MLLLLLLLCFCSQQHSLPSQQQRKVPVPEGLDLDAAIDDEETQKYNKAAKALAKMGTQTIAVSFTTLAGDPEPDDYLNVLVNGGGAVRSMASGIWPVVSQ
jgi:hypothetical protein